jgi:hypothetical protein
MTFIKSLLQTTIDFFTPWNSGVWYLKIFASCSMVHLAYFDLFGSIPQLRAQKLFSNP